MCWFLIVGFFFNFFSQLQVILVGVVLYMYTFHVVKKPSATLYRNSQNNEPEPFLIKMHLQLCLSIYIQILHSMWNWNSHWNASLRIFKELFQDKIANFFSLLFIFIADFTSSEICPFSKIAFCSSWLLKHREIKRKTKQFSLMLVQNYNCNSIFGQWMAVFCLVFAYVTCSCMFLSL